MSLLNLYLCGGTYKGAPDPIFAGKSQEYKIERIVTHKKTRIRTVYLVRWRVYDAIEDIWLREKDLANASSLLLIN